LHPWVLTASLLSLCILLTLAWVLRGRRRYAPDYESLLSHLDQPFREYFRLPDDSSEMQLRHALDEALWRDIHGWHGLRRLYRNSGILLTMRLRLEEEIGCADATRRSRGCDEALLLRLTLLGSLVEAALVRRFPRIPMQRLFLRSAVDQYVEMRSYIRAALEHLKPELVSRFDAVV